MSTASSALPFSLGPLVASLLLLALLPPSAAAPPSPPLPPINSASRTVVKQITSSSNPQTKFIINSYFDLIDSNIVGCPTNIFHTNVVDAVGRPPAVEGVVDFSSISVAGQKCSSKDGEGRLEIVSYDYTRYNLKLGNPLNLTYRLERNVTIAGVDYSIRECGTYSDSYPILYYFTESVLGLYRHLVRSRLLSSFTVEGGINNLIGNERWLITLPQKRQSKSNTRICLFKQRKDSTSDQSPSPSPPLPSTGPSEDGEGGQDDGSGGGSADDGTDGGVDDSSDDPAKNTTFQQAAEDGKEEGTNVFDNTCFPADATVRLRCGRVKTMDQLQIGDWVRSGSQSYSQVFMFTHREMTSYHTFIQLLTARQEKLVLSPSHFVYLAGGKLSAARDVAVGERLILANGSSDVIVDKSWVRRRGLFNPQTLDGDIVVNDILASTYTERVQPRLAHALLLPLRAAFSNWGWSMYMLEHGVPKCLVPLLG